MRKIVIFILLTQIYACIPSRIYHEFDEFENLRKFKLTQIYNAKRDFIGHVQIKINYYKSISQSSEVKISARLLVYASAEDGDLGKTISFRMGQQIYDLNFYNYKSSYDAFHDIDYDVDQENSTISVTSKADENIRHIADFDISNELGDKILNNEILSLRFFIGKEAYTVRFSKFKLKQLKKFLLIQ